MAFFDWLGWQYPDIADISFAVANAGKRTPRQGAWMKAEGLKAGVWDVCIPWPARGIPGLWIEFKEHPRKLSPSQKLWGKKMADRGYRMTVAYSWEEASAHLSKYLVGHDSPVME